MAASNTPRDKSSRVVDPALTAALAFERPILELERKIEELKAIPDVSLNGELKPLERKRDRLLQEIYNRQSRGTMYNRNEAQKGGASGGINLQAGAGSVNQNLACCQ